MLGRWRISVEDVQAAYETMCDDGFNVETKRSGDPKWDETEFENVIG